ncbi:unnamed protein product [Rhizophagus irregularis]|nr:unnamed protein product [Rhizophagus irregularis]
MTPYVKCIIGAVFKAKLLFVITKAHCLSKSPSLIRQDYAIKLDLSADYNEKVTGAFCVSPHTKWFATIFFVTLTNLSFLILRIFWLLILLTYTFIQIHLTTP